MLLCGKRRFVVVPALDCIERYGQCHKGEQEYTRPKRDMIAVVGFGVQRPPWVNPADHAVDDGVKQFFQYGCAAK